MKSWLMAPEVWEEVPCYVCHHTACCHCPSSNGNTILQTIPVCFAARLDFEKLLSHSALHRAAVAHAEHKKAEQSLAHGRPIHLPVISKSPPVCSAPVCMHTRVLSMRAAKLMMLAHTRAAGHALLQVGQVSGVPSVGGAHIRRARLRLTCRCLVARNSGTFRRSLPCVVLDACQHLPRRALAQPTNDLPDAPSCLCTQLSLQEDSTAHAHFRATLRAAQHRGMPGQLPRIPVPPQLSGEHVPVAPRARPDVPVVGALALGKEHA